ncbi:MAG: hypothetical protein RL036_1056 [Actinomycetota bacterium]|jgi:hypothetical protein
MKKLISISASIALAGASLMATASSASATSVLGNYYLATSNTVGNPQSIYQLDPVTLQPISTAIATFAANNMIEGLEVDATNGVAYAMTYGYSSTVTTQFWSIDILTGAATLVNPDVSSAPGLNDRNVTDLGLDPVTGILYGRSDDGSSLVTFDKTTGSATAFVTPPAGSMSSLSSGFGFAIDDQQNRIWTGRSGSGSNYTTYLGAASSQGVVYQIGRSTTGSLSANSMDFAPNGDLILWRGGNPARSGIISAASYSSLSKDVSGGPSATSTTLITTALSNAFVTDSDAFAVANVAPAMARTVSYDPNTGTGTESATVGTGTVTVSSGTHMTLAGYTLSGWNTAANGTGTAVALGASFTPGANLTLYAQWVLAPVTVTSKYEGPLFSPIENRLVNSALGGKITLTGRVLSKVSKISIGTIELSFIKTAEGNLDVTLPAGKPGSGDLKVTFEGGSLVWENAFKYVDPTSVRPPFVYHAPKSAKKTVKKKK